MGGVPSIGYFLKLNDYIYFEFKGFFRRNVMNIRRVLCCALFAISSGALFQVAQAQTFGMSAGSGGVSVWRSASGEKEQVFGASAIGIGDTLFASGEGDVVIQIESGSKILVKGGSVVAFGGQGGALDVALDDGQVFLDRGPKRELAAVRILANGYAFTPVGTAAAVKITRQSAPTVAVLRGSVRMQNAQGESVSVGARQYGTVNNNGQLVSGELNERGLQQLEAWSGVKAEAPQLAQAAPPPEDNSREPPPQSAESAASAADAVPPAPSAAVPITAEDDGQPDKQKAEGKDGKKADSGPTPLFSKPDFELSAGMTTVNGEPWTRLALGVDIPIWKFGVFLDLELFIDPESQVSDKGWDFKDNTAEAIFRKIRYVRFGRESDPLFVKFGGLSGVTLGYGIIMDRFTNMLRYPDEKLLGLQFNLNDISPLGITLQTLISDFAEMKDDGGVYAARLAVKPFKPSGIFLLDGLSVGGTFAMDANTHAPAKKWGENKDYEFLKEMSDSSDDFEKFKGIYQKHYSQNIDSILFRGEKEIDVINNKSDFSIWGVDAGLPIIDTKLLSVVLYGQYASRADSVDGWGIGAPGVAIKVWKLWGNVEYRIVEGRFTPGFFDMYYLDERYSRGLLQEKSQYIDSVSLNGVFGRLGMDVFGALKVDGSYQYMIGEDALENTIKDQRFEITAGLGDAIISRIPKINVAEVYVRNSNLGGSTNWKYGKDDIPMDGSTDEDGYTRDRRKAGFFDRSPFMYWGYRAGFEITAGASLIWDYRYGWKIENGRLVPDNHILLQTALRF